MVLKENGDSIEPGRVMWVEDECETVNARVASNESASTSGAFSALDDERLAVDGVKCVLRPSLTASSTMMCVSISAEGMASHEACADAIFRYARARVVERLGGSPPPEARVAARRHDARLSRRHGAIRARQRGVFRIHARGRAQRARVRRHALSRRRQATD